MQTKESNISVLLLFGFFLIVSYSSFVSLVASGWSYEPISKMGYSNSQQISAEKILGINNVNISNVAIEQTNNLIDQKSYILKNTSIDNEHVSIIETTEASMIKVENRNSIESIEIINNFDCSLIGVNVSFNNKQSWVYWNGLEWAENSDNSLNNYMPIQFFKEIKQADYFLSNGYLPGISKNLHFRLAINSEKCTNIEALVRFGK